MPDFSAIFKSISLPSDLANYVVYAAIILITLIGFIKCLFPLWGTTRALRKATVILEKDTHSTNQTPRWQSDFFLGSRLEGSWKRFLQNARELDRRSLPCNVEDYINDDTVTHGPGNASLAELIPSLLTSLGILGTFLGLTQGLTGLDMTDTQALMNGIPKLLEGMKYAFGTSVAGISCSLIFNMLNRIAQGSSYRAIDEFIDTFTLLAMRRPLDVDVQMMIQNQDSYNLIASPTDGLVPQLTGSIEMAVARAMNPVAQSMDQFLIGATRGQVEGVNRIVTSFVDQMNRSLNTQFLQLGQTMSEVTRNQELSLERVDASIRAAGQIVEDAGRLHQLSDAVMVRFETYVSQLSAAGKRDEQFEQASGDLLQKMQSASREQAAALKQIQEGQEQLRAAIGDFRQTSSAVMDKMHKADLETAGKLNAAGASMTDASDKLSHSYQHFVTDVVEGMSRSLGLFDQNMTAMVESLGRKLDTMKAGGTDSTSASSLAEMQRLLTSMEKSMKQTAETLKQLSEAEEA